MIDWNGCEVVVKRPGYLSGAPALRAGPRVPPETIVENMDAGESAKVVIRNFALRTPIEDVLAVYEYARRQPADIAV